jgi:hypothetical protein
LIIESTSTTTTLNAIAALIQAIAWPIVALLFLLLYRAKIGSLFDVLIKKLKEARHVKAGQLEIDTAEEIQQVVQRTAEAAGVQDIKKEIPENQIKAAQLVGEKLDAAPIAYSQKVDVVYRQVYELVDEYETTRQMLPGGPRRTQTMNETAAKMRALAFAAYPLLPSLMSGKKTGERLAAICTLQVKPELSHFYWLVDRIVKEEQPFIFFQAAVAILELVKSHSRISREVAEPAITAAIEHLRTYRGVPDQNTIDVLSEALQRLEKPSLQQ